MPDASLRVATRCRFAVGLLAMAVASLMTTSADASESSDGEGCCQVASSSFAECSYWGAWAPTSWGEASAVAEVEAAAGISPDLFGFFQGWPNDEPFDAARASAVIERGAAPVVTWEPYDYGGGVDQPTYALRNIIAGNFDAYIASWAGQVRDWGRPLWLRFAHEMNGSWYPWAEGVNGNVSGEYVQAWRHVHDIFEREGASNVRWIWAPNIGTADTTDLAGLYPGDGYVDLVGVDGYNWGATEMSFETHWTPFEDVFGQTLDDIRTITSRPILIAETASAEVGGDKATWIRDMFAALDRHPDILGFMWFHYDKEADWRLTSSDAARRAFAEGIQGSRFDCVAGFRDVSGVSPHADAIDAVVDAGIAGGFSDGTFRPNGSVTRGQMASFLDRALDLPEGQPAFTDVAGTTHAEAIRAVAAAGIASGYDDGTYRPALPVTRGQMAAFLQRALDLPPGQGGFSDVEGHTHAAAIGAVAEAGIAGGFSDGTFRPDLPVSRAQMSTFLYRALLSA